jgi:hypothetical protein
VPAVVAIEVSAVTVAQPEWVAQMVDACSASLDDGTCVYVARDRNEAPVQASRRARVTWDGAGRATIVVDSPQSGQATAERTLQFQVTDEPLEQWRTIGFTTALLARGPTERPSALTPPVAPMHNDFSALATARLLASSASSTQGPKAGGQLRLEGRAWQAPWLLGVAVEYTAAPWKVPGIEGRANWTELSAGVAWYVEPSSAVQVFTRLDVCAQRVGLGGQKKEDQQELSFWQPGVRFGVDVALPVTPAWAVVVGGQATVVRSPIEVRADGKLVTEIPTVSAGANVGVQHRF